MKSHPSTAGTGRERPAQRPHRPEPPPTRSDRCGATYHRLKAHGAAVFWRRVYLALTGAFLFAGALGTVYVATVMGLDSFVVIFTLAVGSAAASPTMARLILIRVTRRFADSAATRDYTAAATGPPAIAQRSEEVMR